MWVQSRNLHRRRLYVLQPKTALLRNGPVVLPAQLRQVVRRNLPRRRTALLPRQLQQKAFRKTPRPYPRRVQSLDNRQRFAYQLFRNFQLQQAVYVLLRQIAVLVYQLRQIFRQGQQRLWKTLPGKLVTQKCRQSLQLPVRTAWLADRSVLVGKRRPLP